MSEEKVACVFPLLENYIVLSWVYYFLEGSYFSLVSQVFSWMPINLDQFSLASEIEYLTIVINGVWDVVCWAIFENQMTLS